MCCLALEISLFIGKGSNKNVRCMWLIMCNYKCCMGAFSTSSIVLPLCITLSPEVCYCLAVLLIDSHSLFMDLAEVPETSRWEVGEEHRVAEMPHPQAAATANLLLFHCFHSNGGGVLLSSKVKWWYRRLGEGLGNRSRWWVGSKGNTIGSKCRGKKKGNPEEDCCSCRWNSGNTRKPSACLLALSAWASVRHAAVEMSVELQQHQTPREPPLSSLHDFFNSNLEVLNEHARTHTQHSHTHTVGLV